MLRMDYLYYFLAVAQTKSINAAAQKINITPPAISHALKNLENDLNLTLFTRTSKGVTLTEDGLIIANKIQEIITHLDELETIAQTLNSQHQQTILPSLDYLTLFSESSVFDSQLPAISRKLYKKFQELDLIVAEQPLNKVIDELSNDTNAIAVLLIGSDSLERIHNNWPNIEIRKIASYSLQLIAAKNSKWLPKELLDKISMNDILKLPLIKTNWISSAQYTYESLNLGNEKYNYTAIAPTLSVLNSFLENDVGVCLGCETPFMNLKNTVSSRINIPIISDSNLQIEYAFLYNKHLHPTLADAIYSCIAESYNESVKYSIKG